MAEPAFASVEDLIARMGDLDGGAARAALEDASSLIHNATNRLWITTDGQLSEDTPGIARTICCAVARRILENPELVTSERETIGGYSGEKSYGNDSNDAYLKKAERAELRKAAGLVGLSVIGTTRGELETPAVRDPWPYDPDTDTIPWT